MSHDPPDGDRPLLLERFSSLLVQRLTNRTVLLLSGAGIVAVGLVDVAVSRLVGFDFALTPLYLLPVGSAAWASGATAGLLFSFYAAAVEAAAAWISARGTPEPWAAALGVAMELIVFVGAAYTIARLRWHLSYERHLSHTDPVTGIGNLRSFEEAARRELSRMARRTSPISVAYFDVDHFKDVNDRHGHAAGDLLLRAIGAALRGSVRTLDTVARVGGDEFVVLFPETDSATCRRAVERVRGLLGEAVAAAGCDCTFSVGAVTFVTPPRGVAELIQASDKAMYAVKRDRRDGAEYQVVVPAGA